MFPLAVEILVQNCLSKVLNYQKDMNYGNKKQQKLYNGDQTMVDMEEIHAIIPYGTLFPMIIPFYIITVTS